MFLLLCAALLLGFNAYAADNMAFSGLGGVWCHGMVIDGQYAYISGLEAYSIDGQPYNGGYSDALLFKLFLQNASLVWARSIGGSGQDLAGVVSFYYFFSQAGIGLSAQTGVVALPFTTYSSDIPGIQNAGGTTVVSFFYLNGTFVRHVTGLSSTSSSYSMDLQFNPATQTFFFSAQSDAWYQSDVWQISANGSSTLHFATLDNQYRCRSIAFSSTAMICSGSFNNDMFINQYAINTSHLVKSNMFRSISGGSIISACSYDPVTNVLYVGGESQGVIAGFESLGSGAMFAAQFYLGNDTLTILTRYGPQDTSSGYGLTAGIQFDPYTGVLVVSGQVKGAAWSPYGDYEAVVLLYARNMSLVSATTIGGGNADSGSYVKLPYVLVSTVDSVQSVDGKFVGVGPAIMQLDLAPYMPSPAVIAATTATATSSIASKKSRSTSISKFSLTSSVSEAAQMSQSSVTSLNTLSDKQLQPVSLPYYSKFGQSSLSAMSSQAEQGTTPSQLLGGLSLMTLVIVVAGPLLLIMCGSGAYCYIYNRRRRNFMLSKAGRLGSTTNSLSVTEAVKSTMVNPYTSTSMSSTAYSATVGLTSVQGTTTLIGANEVAVPSYLEVTNGIEFVVNLQSPPIAKGGGGIIVMGQWQNYGRGIQFCKQGKQQCVIKAILQTSTEVFQQEVALMHYFRGVETIVELLGYNMREMTIIMPHYPLGSLSRVIKDESITWNMIVSLRLASDMFDALQTIHDAGVVHNDIKSSNYLVAISKSSDELHAVLTDFGVCTILNDANLVAGLTINSVTGKTISYASPEIFGASDSTASLSPHVRKARDIFAAAVIWNELITRKLAWKSDNDSTSRSVIDRVLAGERPSTRPSVTLAQDPRLNQVQKLIAIAWDQEPSVRPPASVILGQLNILLKSA